VNLIEVINEVRKQRYIYKSVSKATTFTKVDLKYINFRGDTLGATQHQLNKPASYEDILNAL
jgi:hypothetical protein